MICGVEDVGEVLRGEVVAAGKCLEVCKGSVEGHCKGCCSCFKSDGRGACVKFVEVDVVEVDGGRDMHVLLN
jgi:hypothetical protein